MKNDLARILGSHVRDLREARNLTQAGFADLSGLPITFIRRVERGEVKNPSLERLGVIADTLNVPVENLFKVHDRIDETSMNKQMLIDQIARALRLHGIAEIRAVKSILREVFAIQRLGRK